MEKEKLLEARNIIDDIYKNGINDNYLKELYKIFGNSNINLIINNHLFNTAVFVPNYSSIIVNIDNSIKWVNKVIDESIEYFEINNIELLKSYLFISLLCHEIEHSNQKLIADNKLEPNYEYKKFVYKDILDITSKKDYLIPNPISLINDIIKFIIYKKNEYDFILERNASVEGFNTASLVAKEANEKDILDYMIYTRNAFMLNGYISGCEGTLKYTYRKLKMLKKYNNLVIPTDLPLIEKIKDGLELTEKEHEKVLTLLKSKKIN